MTISEILNLINTVGFPIVVAVYVLWRLNGKMAENTKAIRELTQEMIRKKEHEKAELREMIQKAADEAAKKAIGDWYYGRLDERSKKGC